MSTQLLTKYSTLASLMLGLHLSENPRNCDQRSFYFLKMPVVRKVGACFRLI